jgi:hypothetical protein
MIAKRSGGRHQGGTRTARRRAVGSRWPGPSTCVKHVGQSAATPAGPDPPLPIPRSRPGGTAGGLDRSPRRPERRGQDPPHGCPTSTRNSCVGRKPLIPIMFIQNRYNPVTAHRRRSSTCLSKSTWPSYRGHQSRTSIDSPRSPTRPSGTARRRIRWRWPGFTSSLLPHPPLRQAQVS